MTRGEAEKWLKGPCPGGPGHEQDGSGGCRWARHDCYACVLEALVGAPAAHGGGGRCPVCKGTRVFTVSGPAGIVDGGPCACVAEADSGRGTVAFPGYVLVGEAEEKPAGKWRKVELSSCWAPKEIKADRDPRGNAHGRDEGARWCVSLDTGLVEVREGDRIVLLRPVAKDSTGEETGA